jgi:membrane protease YdiL (CAAX protease family)
MDMLVEKITDFALRRPLLSAISLILSSLVVEIFAGFLAVVLFRVEQTDPLFAPLVLLVTTLYLICLFWLFVWLKATGIAYLGSWQGWGVALVLLTYYLLELIFSFFGEFGFSVPANAVSGLRVSSVLMIAIYEEVLFRGGILYVLVRGWGTNRTGVMKAVVVSALLFGAIHAINAITGDPSEVVGQIAIAVFEGIWLAAIVLRWGSIWSVILIHGVTNWVLQTKALGYADYHGTANSYVLAVLLGLPLVALGVWSISRTSPRFQRDNTGSATLAGDSRATGT